MNKTDLINAMAEKTGLTKVQAKNALEAFMTTTSDALKKGDKISLVGFGSWQVVKRAARTGYNPRAKKAIKIPASKVVKFRAGSKLGK